MAALEVLGDTQADQQVLLSQSVVATSVLYMIYGCIMYGLALWYTLLELELDTEGNLRDKLQLFQMANIGVRCCWWAIMTWLVALIAGCAIFGVYISTTLFYIQETLVNQETLPVPDRNPVYPECPTSCLDLWRINFIDVPKSKSCRCQPDTLTAAVGWLDDAQGNIPGCLVGAFFMYIVGGFWRAMIGKQYATIQKCQDVAGRLAGGGAAPAAKSSRADQYQPVPTAGRGRGGPGGRAGPGRGRGRSNAV
ncbi:hypothetical protein HYH03_008221 [Edaphochlamys debaryana]|uniref:Uncharacterized protein n=1 Tax=Edaphochlamys debaryana TaxID=47281 RepID=A0A836BZ90_9CHLO|nr:hypothetical protein HYH03_008221 [Edaphochlamys debaryana]|eukprot:KAG2493707.1 hypothetical protein HYH03_008221 [Edaphochlamys debaryana]